MQQLTPEIARASLSASQQQTESTTSASVATPEAPPHWLRRLWERKAATFGHAWTSTHGLSPQEANGALTVHGDTWAKALAGIDGQQLGAGLSACIAEGGEFPPSAPRFRAMCLGIPSFAQVRIELTGPDANRCPFTRYTWGLIDGHRYRQASADQSDRLLHEAYEVAKRLRMNGTPMPEHPIAAITDNTNRPPIPATREQAAAHMADIADLLGVAPSPAEVEAELQAHYGNQEPTS